MKNKGRTWSRGTNSRLPFGVIVNLNLSIDGCESTNQTGLQIFFLTGIITFIWVESSSGQDGANLVF